MTTWRSYDLESLLGGATLDGQGLTEQVMRRLEQQQVPEGEQLDYKAIVPPTKQQRKDGSPAGKETDLPEFAKDVAAFANGRGGLLLYGMSEKAGTKTPEAIVGLPGLKVDDVEQRLLSTLINYVAPVPEVTVIEVPITGGPPCLAVVVPPSMHAPHGVSYARRGSERRPLDYPVRIGAHTRWMTEPEIASRYLERIRSAADRAAFAQSTVAAAVAKIATAQTVWPYLAVIPERPVSIPISNQEVSHAKRWITEAQITSPLRSSHLEFDRIVPAPGRTTMTLFPAGARPVRPVAVSEIYAELHTDGSAFVAVDGHHRLSEERKNARGLDLLDLVDTMILGAQVGTRWARDQAGAFGAATVIAGVSSSGHGGPTLFHQFELQTSIPGGRFDPVSTADMMVHDPQSVTSVDLAGVDSVSEQLRVAYQACAGVLAWFGIAEPDQITAAGRLNVDAWAGGAAFANEVQARQWQDRRDLAIDSSVPNVAE